MKEWSDLNEISYLEGPRISDLFFTSRTDPVSLGGVGGGEIQKNYQKWGICDGDQILIKFDNRRILCFKALILNSDQIRWHLGELEGKPEILENV